MPSLLPIPIPMIKAKYQHAVKMGGPSRLSPQRLGLFWEVAEIFEGGFDE